ncbi:MAG: DUF2723 domain-containing protein [Anaerolineaceae bacterium]
MNRKLGKRIAEVFLSGECLALCSFLIYVITLTPGVYGFDSAEFATGVYSMGIVHPPGYPLYMLIGKLFTFLPFRTIAYRLNLMSAFFAAITLYFLYKIILRLTLRNWIAWVASAFLAFSIYFWQMSVVVEVYTLHTFFLVVEIYILLKWRETGRKFLLVLFAFVFGLSLTNHTTGLLFAPGFAWMIFSSPKPNWNRIGLWLAMIASFAITLLIYLYIPIRANSATPLNYIHDYYAIDVTTLPGLFWMVSGRAYHFFAFGYASAEIFQQVVNGLKLIWQNYLGVGFILGIVGLAALMKRDWKYGVGLCLLLLGNFIFYVNYRVLDKDTMFLPTYVVYAIFIGYALIFLDDLLHQLFTSAESIRILRLAYPGFWVMIALLVVVLNWQWADMSQTLGPESFTNSIMDSTKSGATVIASWSPAVVLEYYQIVEGKRPDLHIYNQSRSDVANYYKHLSSGVAKSQLMAAVNEDELDAINHAYSKGIVYSIEYDPVIAEVYEYRPMGVFYQLIKKDSQ